MTDPTTQRPGIAGGTSPHSASANVRSVEHQVTAIERRSRAEHAGAVVWLTGLPGAGKSTLAMALERALFDRGWSVYAIDGDNLRRGLSADLGFMDADRKENIRRVGAVAAMFADAGLICVTAVVAPFADDRRQARVAAGGRPFFEVHVRADLAVCERRDPKGLYALARSGKLQHMTGIDSPYERPENPDLVVDTQQASAAECVALLVDFVVANCRLGDSRPDRSTSGDTSNG